MATVTGSVVAEQRNEGVTPARLQNMPSRLLSLAAMHAQRLVNERLAEVDARKWHYAALVVLHESGPASQATLSRSTGIFGSDLVAVINELADRGHVSRVPDPADRRRNIIALTGQGRRHLHRLEKILDAIQNDLLTPFSQPERDQFTDMLTRLLDHVRERTRH